MMNTFNSKYDGKSIQNFLMMLSLIVSLFVGIFVPFRVQAENAQLETEILESQKEFEINQNKKEAIPYFRLTKSQDTYTTMEIFKPNRELQLVEVGNGVYSSESYISILDFNFENLVDNIAFFSHIEYGNVAYELVDLNLCSQKGEIVTFSSENKFISLGFTNKLKIVVKTRYDDYYSYTCLLNSSDKEGDTHFCTVESIGRPEPYNIDNEIYKNMYIHVRDLIVFPDNIIFGVN